ncbi:MAG: hypothetical protein WC236_08510 [Gallionellaceae bacterium]
MNPIRIIRSLLLMLFVLLQCVAPLAHAHVNGDNASQRVHFDGVGPAWSGDHHQHAADAAQLAAEEHQSAVVCPPPEYRSGSPLLEQPAIACQSCLPVPQQHPPLVSVDVCRQAFYSSPYQHPCSQAPPV